MLDMNQIAAKSLGDSTSYAVFTDKFDPSLLNPMPRSIARDHWGITGTEWGAGFDVWTCHEATFLLNSGFPVAGTLKFVYGASSEFMVESKSAKLYLNSFDMCRMGDTLGSAIEAYEAQVARDLTAVIGSAVSVKFHSSVDFATNQRANLLSGFTDLSTIVPCTEQFTDFNGERHHITLSDGNETSVFTNALRSRCRHTKQKDTGLAAIQHRSTSGKVIDATSVFKQIVSLREVNEFHEFCAEKLFVEIMKDASVNDDVLVMLLYSRRGSLDINPVRASSLGLISQALIDPNQLTEKVQGQ